MKCPVCIAEGKPSTVKRPKRCARPVFVCSEGHAFEAVQGGLRAWRTEDGIWATIDGDPWMIADPEVVAQVSA